MKPRTRIYIAKLYGYSTRTFTRRLSEHNVILSPRKFIEIGDQLSIYARLGRPCKMKLEEWQALHPILLKYCRDQGLPEPPDW